LKDKNKIIRLELNKARMSDKSINLIKKSSLIGDNIIEIHIIIKSTNFNK